MVIFAAFLFNVLVLGLLFVVSFKFIALATIAIWMLWNDIPPFIEGAISALMSCGVLPDGFFNPKVGVSSVFTVMRVH